MKKKGENKMTKRLGFTLAEVLITLGIIGVVAAMTIPTLISNTNGAQFKTAYKKALSTLNQAVLMNLALDDTDFSTLKAENVAANTSGRMSDLLTARLQSATQLTTTGYTISNSGNEQLKVDITCQKSATYADGHPCKSASYSGTETTKLLEDQTINFDTTVANYRIYSFADGTAFGYNVNAKNCTAVGTAECYGFIDVNGANNPNTVIHCADAEDSVCEASEITDIFPVFFHGQTVEPATDSARAVLFGK